ncbi:MAG: hypothetical protein JWO78_1089 [Micavibrio sp.]|nr:hypothetical protein [Micavibrio sp.]
MAVIKRKSDPFVTRNGWTPERRFAQSARARANRLWQHTTGPRTALGKARSSRNALKHGARSAEMALVSATLRAQRHFMKLLNENSRARRRYYRSNGDPSLRPVVEIHPLLLQLHHRFMQGAREILKDDFLAVYDSA